MSLHALVWAMAQDPGSPLQKLVLLMLSDGSAGERERSFDVADMAAACQCQPVELLDALGDLAAQGLITGTEVGHRVTVILNYPESEGSAAGPPTRATGNVYILRSGNQVKVGIAQDVAKRVRSIQVGAPWPVELVQSFTVLDPYKVERRAHALLAAHRTSGEWFLCSAFEAARAVDQAIDELGAAQ